MLRVVKLSTLLNASNGIAKSSSLFRNVSTKEAIPLLINTPLLIVLNLHWNLRQTIFLPRATMPHEQTYHLSLVSK